MSNDFDFRGIAPESWLCIDCGMNTSPGALNRSEPEAAARALGARWRSGRAGIPLTIGFDAYEWTRYSIHLF
jgi:hypothetical protein